MSDKRRVILTDWKYGYTLIFSNQRKCAEYIFFIGGASEFTNTLRAIRTRVSTCVRGDALKIYNRFEVSRIYER